MAVMSRRAGLLHWLGQTDDRRIRVPIPCTKSVVLYCRERAFRHALLLKELEALLGHLMHHF